MRDFKRIRALLFGLSEDVAGELCQPLAALCGQIRSIARDGIGKVAGSDANIIFCGSDIQVVKQLRRTMPDAAIVVVSRHPEVTSWLDSIEAGATDYCAAPFETHQVKWILETSMRSMPLPVFA